MSMGCAPRTQRTRSLRGWGGGGGGGQWGECEVMVDGRPGGEHRSPTEPPTSPFTYRSPAICPH